MIENYHYKGNFDFYYHPTNQGKLIKEFLRDVVTDKLRKEARKRPWKSYSRKEKLFAIQLVGHVIHKFSPQFVAKYLDPDYQKGEASEEVNIRTSVDLYHAMNHIAKNVIYPRYLNVKHDLACRALEDVIDALDFENSV